MADDFARRYPAIDRFVREQGWIELGADDHRTSFVRALDPGGLVWEGNQRYPTLDAALVDLEQGLTQWLKQYTGDELK